MIITNVCLLLEALSIVICLHYLYGEKFRLDIATVSFLSINMIAMTAINYLELSKVYTMIIYPIIIIYCAVRFGRRIKALFINCILCFVIVGGIQFILMFGGSIIFRNTMIGDLQLLFINAGAVLILQCILAKCKVNKWSLFLQSNERIITISLGICVLVFIMCMVKYKKANLMETYQYALFFFSIILIVLLSIQLSKFKVKAKEVETELKMQKLYAESFYGLTENIRMKQHEFHSHISTIYSFHYTYKTYEELVKAQKEYCDLVMKENHFNKFLVKGNPVIAGFLYGKLVEIEKKGIEIAYIADFEEFNVGIPVYKIVEILGNLIDNAIEALEFVKDDKKIYVAIEEADFNIEVRNTSPYVDYDKMGKFFVKGYSEKGKNRGLGLYNVKKICDEYGMSIGCQNKEFDERNWISFEIKKAILQ